MKKLLVIFLTLITVASLAACGDNSGSDANSDESGVTLTTSEFISVQPVMDKIKAENLLPEDYITLTTDDLIDYYGIESDWVVESSVIQNSSGYQDEIIIIHASNPSAVKSALEEHLEYQKNEMRDYSPEQFAILEKCKVEAKGNYIALFISENAARMSEIFNETF